MQIHGIRLKCIKEAHTLHGNYDTASAANLMIVFEKCDRTKPKNTCKSEEEIEEWMTFKYIYTLDNQEKFVS